MRMSISIPYHLGHTYAFGCDIDDTRSELFRRQIRHRFRRLVYSQSWTPRAERSPDILTQPGEPNGAFEAVIRFAAGV